MRTCDNCLLFSLRTKKLGREVIKYFFHEIGEVTDMREQKHDDFKNKWKSYLKCEGNGSTMINPGSKILLVIALESSEGFVNPKTFHNQLLKKTSLIASRKTHGAKPQFSFRNCFNFTRLLNMLLLFGINKLFIEMFFEFARFNVR